MKLLDSVRFLKGCGPVRVKALRDLGIDTIQNLLRHYPREWIFMRRVEGNDFKVGDSIIAKGKVTFINRPYGGKTVAHLSTSTNHTIKLMWFNSPWVAKQLRGRPGITAWGRVTTDSCDNTGHPVMINPRWCLGEVGPIDKTALCVYPASAKASSEFIGKLIRQVLDARIRPGVPQSELELAYEQIHRPTSKQVLKRAKHTLKVDELTRLFDGCKADRALATVGAAPVIPFDFNSHYNFRGILPFEFTGDQVLATHDLDVDMMSSEPMHRLLQGDVGCGKTVVAVGASVAVANAGYQTIVLCPTKVLAQQHYRKWQEYIGDCGYTVGLLTSETSRGYCHKRDVIIATTSALSDKIEFRNVGLLIIDEEQKFGREQKELLAKKYPGIHRLYMTATPIPQVLCMTAFGDLDVTTIKTMPPKRRERVTELVYPQDVDIMNKGTAHRMSSGDRVYKVFPRIEGAGGVSEAFDDGRRTELAEGIDRRGLLHGDMPHEGNRATMEMFARGDISTLYCTSMIEVGVDVPEANIMIIHEAHMFGLSQLHQLRGRIGRGDRPSVCYLMANTDDPAALEKLQFVADHDNGFDIAQYDLAIRGPGELVGNRQTGLSELKLVDLVSDFDLIKSVRQEVFNGG